MFQGTGNALLKAITCRLQRTSDSQLGLAVSVFRGTVAITGHLQYEGQRASIINALRSISGVQQVVDRLAVYSSAKQSNQGITSGEQADQSLVRRIEECLREPVYFRDILDATRDQKYRAVLLAWSDIRTRHALERDEHGRYWRAQQA